MRSAAGAVLAFCLGASAALADCAPGQVEVRLAGGGSARFSVELADTPQSRAQGLMFRESMPKSRGMLFIYESPQRAVFWMKNTLIPLDMIFADATGLVTHVHSNAVPHDETGIDGGDGVLAVLEINGGLARRMGIGPGAALRHPAFDPATAAAPCNDG
ncbi:DUF192 domain-containing protein [Szabonella alba]|uniref:DUF192 domain-containing protein n=1 Tax=Szabonella alba TaxID=2804194 RepID=A0A8K0VDI1_9RHOB|nr:DUF192 domain-containing protein [Szabonella alba]MBL4917307.1 DUF192 domain-containing protein [Szabonella alba]